MLLKRNRVVIILGVYLLLVELTGSTLAISATSPVTYRSEQQLKMRGTVVCLDISGEPTPESGGDCTQASLEFGFRTTEGTVYSFVQGDPRVPIFEDQRVRNRFLQIIARSAGDRQLEIVHLHAIENGRLVRLYYHCDVCNIDAYAPGPCWCCQEPFEFREEFLPEQASP